MPPFIRKMIVNEGTDNEIAFGYFSVGLRVGPKAVNDDWDVMLVQAMLHYLYPHERGTPNHLCPKVTGIYDKLTARAIWNFQKKHCLEADWFIDPIPPYYNGITVGNKQNLMFTMAKLYVLVMEKAVFEPLAMNPVMDVLGKLTAEFPQIAIATMIMREEAMDAKVF